MSHTGGTNVSGFAGYAVGSAIPTLLQVLNGTPPADTEPIRVIYEPGTRYSYSGGGMEVLQQMAEDVTGMPFRSYMKNNLFDRLGMNSSDFVQPMAGPLARRAAKGHDMDGVMLPGGWRIYPELIAAGLWTTPTDLAHCSSRCKRRPFQSGSAAHTRDGQSHPYISSRIRILRWARLCSAGRQGWFDIQAQRVGLRI